MPNMRERHITRPSANRQLQKPDLIVGIDFGTTCTGCAYMDLSSRATSVRWIQKWPGRTHVNENKVSTLLAYHSSDERPVGWGFLGEKSGENRDEGLQYAEFFKIFLDGTELLHRQQKEPEKAPKSMGLVEKWYEDYLRLLYEHIEFQLGNTLARSWRDAHVKFVFSLPTTWTDKTVVERFREIIVKAGYGCHAHHSVELGLTEAEAAAVHISKEQAGLFQKDDIILVCDAGGGTTDLSVLKVDDIHHGNLSLCQLDVVSGKAIGSVAIDDDFARLVTTKLQQAFNERRFYVKDEDFRAMAWTMAHCAEYQNMKCAFGDPTTRNFSTFSCPAPFLPPDYLNNTSNIANQTMKFDRRDFQAIFDSQITKMFRHMDDQFRRMEEILPGAQINYLVLSGGLGNSAYVQQQLRAMYENGGTSKYPNTRDLRVRIAVDPQLAVCKGLVEDYMQRLHLGRATITTRVCRESYGIVCSVPATQANQAQYAGRSAHLDPVDNKLYYRDMVSWLIKRGEQVSEDKPVTSEFWRILRPGDPNRTFISKVVVSDVDAGRLLPWRTADVHELCDITSTLVGVEEKEFEERNKRKLGLGGSKRHFVVNFQVKVLIGPADLRFQLWFNGRRISADNAIQVAWASASEIIPPLPELDSTPYMQKVGEYL